MAYLELPKNISFKNIAEKKFLSPRTYKILRIKNKRLLPLSSFLENPEPIKGSEVGSSAYMPNSPYKFMRTQAIDDSHFILFQDVESFVPCKKFDFEQAHSNNPNNLVRAGDLFYVKGGNVGAVGISTDDINSVFSSHLLKLKVKKEFLYYVLAVLKSKFGKMQIERLPVGAIEGLDTFKKEYFNIIQIPMPEKENINIIKKVDQLVEEIIKREKEIRRKYFEAISLIKSEIENNQKGNGKEFSLPTYKEILLEKRFDTRIYSERLQTYKNLIKNYKFGYFNNLDEANYVVSRGQNLQESSIGISVYSEKPLTGYYKLILSKYISPTMDVSEFAYLGNRNKLKTLKKGEIVFTCRGYMGKVIISCDEEQKVITNIDNVHIDKDGAKIEENITLGFYLSYLRESGVIEDISIAGSGADSFTKYHFDRILIPKFQEKFSKAISKFYYTGENIVWDNLDEKKTVEKSGIYDLQNQIYSLKNKLNEIIESITEGKL
ncbi:hypothetical protein HYW76_05475 [Candidatus Pacearchaeota archaeon]|nr:hypothetical protein [Candidatus Pacearchaeota archaeon]